MRRMLSVAVAAAIASLIVIPVAAGWAWPADGPVLRAFSLAEDRYAAGQHRGIDIGEAVGAPVRAPAAGTVSFAGPVPGGGRAVTILTADGYAITLLQLGSTVVAPGGTVAEGMVVGRVGESEDAATRVSHVHLGIRVAADPNGYVDPTSLLPARPPVTALEPAAVAAPEPAGSAARRGRARAAGPRRAGRRYGADRGHCGRPGAVEPGRGGQAARRRAVAAEREVPCVRHYRACTGSPSGSRAAGACPQRRFGDSSGGCSADRAPHCRLEGVASPCLDPTAPRDRVRGSARAGHRSAATPIRRSGRARRAARCDQARRLVERGCCGE